jgi:hypothetical protein
VVDVVAATLGRALTTPEALRGLRVVAGALPAVPRGGIEVRLGAGSELDLQQCIRLDRPEEVAAAGLAGLLGSPRAAELVELWLELDAGRATRPSLFVGFQQEPAPDRAGLAGEVLDLLSGRAAHGQVQQICETVPEGAFVSHVGVMTRRAGGIRVNVKRVPLAGVVAYLRSIAWPGPVRDVERLAAQLEPAVARATVCLDAGEQLQPTLGLEVVATHWPSLFDELIRGTLCRPEKADAVLAWQSDVTPAECEKWPAALIAQSLLRPRDWLGVFRRAISHVKLTWRGPGAVGAKGYLAFEHVWRHA